MIGRANPANPHSSLPSNHTSTKVFENFHTTITQFKSKHGIQEPAFGNQNLRILLAACRRFDDALAGNFYTANELEKLHFAHQLRGRNNLDISEINAMKDGLAIALKQKKYASFIKDFDDEKQTSVFSLLALSAAQRVDAYAACEQVELIQKRWKERSKFAGFSSQALFEATVSLNQLESYCDLLEKDLKHLNGNSYLAMYKCYTYHLQDKKSLQELNELKNKLREQIKIERAALAAAMVERLALIPRGYLAKLSQYNGYIFNDDVVFETLDALVKTKLLPPSYTENFKKQSKPHKTLTYDLILRFNSFIGQFGSLETNRRLTELYASSSELVIVDQGAPSPQPERDEYITIPLCIPGHYEVKVRHGESDGFVYIDSVTDLKDKVPSIEDTFPSKDAKPAGYNECEVSFLDLGTGQRIVIPTVDKVEKISCKDEKISALTALVLDDEYEQEHIEAFEAVYLFSESEEQTLDVFAKRFADQSNSILFIKTARDIVQFSINKNIEYVASVAFKTVAEAIIETEVTLLSNKAEKDDMLTIKQRLDILRGFYAEFNLCPDEDKFETKVIANAKKIFAILYTYQKDFSQRLLDARVPEGIARKKKAEYLQLMLDHFEKQKFQFLGLAKEKAELDFFMANQKLPKEDIEEAKMLIQRDDRWVSNVGLWTKIVADIQELSNLKIELSERLFEEIRRLRNSVAEDKKHKANVNSEVSAENSAEKLEAERSASKPISKRSYNLEKTQQKIALLLEASVSIDKSKSKDALFEILHNLQENKIIIQKRRTGFRSKFDFSIFGTSSQKNIGKTIKQMGLDKSHKPS